MTASSGGMEGADVRELGAAVPVSAGGGGAGGHRAYETGIRRGHTRQVSRRAADWQLQPTAACDGRKMTEGLKDNELSFYRLP